MRNRGPLFIGSLLVIFGMVLLLGNIFQINIWALCWPTGLILVGVWLLLRPRFALPGTLVNIRFIEDDKRKGQWQVNNEEIWSFINTVRLDMTQATIPAGETTIRMYGFISDIDILVPMDVGCSVSSSAISDICQDQRAEKRQLSWCRLLSPAKIMPRLSVRFMWSPIPL